MFLEPEERFPKEGAPGSPEPSLFPPSIPGSAEKQDVYKRQPYILKNYGSLLPVERLHGFYDIFLHTDSNSECFKNNDYFYELDSDFHLMIVRSCPNVYIQNNYSLILTQNARFRYMTGNEMCIRDRYGDGQRQGGAL